MLYLQPHVQGRIETQAELCASSYEPLLQLVHA